MPFICRATPPQVTAGSPMKVAALLAHLPGFQSGAVLVAQPSLGRGGGANMSLHSPSAAIDEA